jgi:hypothetical protein
MTDRLDDAERRLQGAEDRLEQAERRLEGTERELQALRDSRQEASSRSEGVEKRFVERLEAAAERIERLVPPPALPSKPGAARAADPPVLTDIWFYAAAIPAVIIVGLSKGGFGGGVAVVGVP